MEKLLLNYSLSEIAIFLVVFFVAVKEFLSLYDFFKERVKKKFDKGYHEIEEKEEIERSIHDLEKFYNEKKIVDDTFAKIEQTFDAINKRIDMLVESDKEDIKSYIVDKHHHLVYDTKWVDDYSLECLEKKFAIYRKEHGNSFVEGLMNEIRDLPKIPPCDMQHKYIGTAEYVEKAKGTK